MNELIDREIVHNDDRNTSSYQFGRAWPTPTLKAINADLDGVSSDDDEENHLHDSNDEMMLIKRGKSVLPLNLERLNV